jgi:cytidine deaminase
MVSAEYGKTSEAGKDKYKEVTLGELLPYSFGPEDLEKPRGDQ